MKENILTRLEELLGKVADERMQFAAERSVAMMQAYCNRTDLPEELTGVGVELAVRLLECGAAATLSPKAKSIREGDISVTFVEGVSKENEILEGFKVELDRYRQMGW